MYRMASQFHFGHLCEKHPHKKKMHSVAKIVVASAMLVAIVQSAYIDIHGHDHDLHEHDLHEYDHQDHLDYHAEPKYSYNYAVHDPHTGDEKQHVEERDGDVVKGQYMLKEADGTTRIVDYKADKHNGFHAVVHKIGEPKHQYEDSHHHHY